MSPDYLDPTVGIPVALILWGIWGVVALRDRRRRR